MKKKDFDQAIQALQASLDAVPSQSAQYTLAYLYKQKGNLVEASKHADAAVKLVKPGDAMAQVRAEQLAKSVSAEADSEGPPNSLGTTVPCQMVGGAKSAFPTPGKSLDDAAKISPGLYVWREGLNGNEYRYYKLRLQSHQTLQIDFRTSDTGGSAGAAIYDGNGVRVAWDAVGQISTLKSIAWSPNVDGWVFFSVGRPDYPGVYPDTLYCVSVR